MDSQNRCRHVGIKNQKRDEAQKRTTLNKNQKRDELQKRTALNAVKTQNEGRKVHIEFGSMIHSQ